MPLFALSQVPLCDFLAWDDYKHHFAAFAVGKGSHVAAPRLQGRTQIETCWCVDSALPSNPKPVSPCQRVNQQKRFLRREYHMFKCLNLIRLPVGRDIVCRHLLSRVSLLPVSKVVQFGVDSLFENPDRSGQRLRWHSPPTEQGSRILTHWIRC